MTDPYKALGLEKGASDAEIRKAFKTLTRKFHPDLHPGDAAAEEKFKDISIAHDLLGDPEKRRRFDAGEIDASGAERPRERYYRDFADATRPGGQGGGFARSEDLADFFARAFGGRGTARPSADQSPFQARGQDVSYSLPIDFLEAVNGATRDVRLPDGKALKVTIPEGAEDRQTLRLKGQGRPGIGGGPAGDAYVELQVAPHAFFERRGDDIHVEVPVTLREAVLGARIEVPTTTGPVSVTVPAGSNTGRTLRLREKGVRDRKSGARGHQFIMLKVMLPNGEEPELAAFLERWTPRTRQDPRKEMLR